MKVSDLLENAKAPFGVSKELASVEVLLDADVSEIPFFPWLRVSEEEFKEISKILNESQIQTPRLKISKSPAPQFYTLELC